MFNIISTQSKYSFYAFPVPFKTHQGLLLHAQFTLAICRCRDIQGKEKLFFQLSNIHSIIIYSISLFIIRPVRQTLCSLNRFIDISREHKYGTPVQMSTTNKLQ